MSKSSDSMNRGNEGGPEDLDGNGIVDFGDPLIVLAAWGPCE